MKKCSKCKREKPTSEFYTSSRARDGYRSWCKDCCREDMARYAQTGYYREYQKRPKARLRIRRTAMKYRQRPDIRIKNMARWFTNHEIRAGRIRRTQCAFCGQEQAEAHHPDYEQPLLIVWLCSNCHRQVHKSFKEKVLRQELKE